jgi:hypothetical protein
MKSSSGMYFKEFHCTAFHSHSCCYVFWHAAVSVMSNVLRYFNLYYDFFCICTYCLYLRNLQCVVFLCLCAGGPCVLCIDFPMCHSCLYTSCWSSCAAIYRLICLVLEILDYVCRCLRHSHLIFI